MATVTDVVVDSQDQQNGRKKVRYTVVLLDNTGATHTHRLPPIMMAPPDDPIVRAPEYGASVLAGFLEDEKRQVAEDAKEQPYVIHDDQGTHRTKKTMPWNTWDDAAEALLKDYLSRPDMVDLADIVNDIIEIPNNEIRAMFGITQSQVVAIRSDVQIAVNTKATISAYVPFLDEDGGWNR